MLSSFSHDQGWMQGEWLQPVDYAYNIFSAAGQIGTLQGQIALPLSMIRSTRADMLDSSAPSKDGWYGARFIRHPQADAGPT